MRVNHFRLRHRRNLFFLLPDWIYIPKFLLKSNEKWESCRGHKPKSELNRKYIEAHACLPFSVLLAIELSLCSHMCDLCSKFEEDRTKAAVSIVDDMGYFGQADTPTHRQIHNQVILYHWTDNNNDQVRAFAYCMHRFQVCEYSE